MAHANLRFVFRSITTLDSRTRKYIHNNMTWSPGSMRIWLTRRSSKRRLCLVYQSRKLITWACLGMNSPHDVSAWTLSGYRGHGYAQAAIWALLDTEGISRSRSLIVFSPITHRIVQRLGYSPRYE